MNEPRAIPIHFTPPADARTGNERAVLAEILNHLAQLAETGAAAAIDLLALPLSDADRSWLQETLGQGEVRAEVDAAGVSEVRETAVAGVWWITHRNADGQTVAELIEITLLPEILRASAADAARACEQLEQILRDCSPEQP